MFINVTSLSGPPQKIIKVCASKGASLGGAHQFNIKKYSQTPQGLEL